MKRLVWCALAALSLAIPVLAQAQDAYVTDNVDLFAGPDPSYPLVAQIPAGTEVGVQGCTDGWEWCDVIAYGSRGWVAGNYIQYDYQNQPVLLPMYGAQIGIPVVTFVIGDYWDRYYRSRPFYGDRATWYNRPYVRRPPPPPSRYPYNGPVHPMPGYEHADERPGHLGPVTPGRPVYAEPGNQGRPVYAAPGNQGRPEYAAPGNQGRPVYAPPGNQGRPANPAQDYRVQQHGNPEASRPPARPPEKKNDRDDHNDNGGH
ncbi:SH3 domain-containing protein [Rhodanobacter sp. MP7CTX1]|uniref:SH3 domain-containing protein n=1 Tax=Rhodanobacter sp. MP7CTX1 TaxID=2723084 RepID=UPI001607025E|nr:SH3 domain-containing protein [Rhodanobacter sp. MP7CTX1]MBB6187164.1 uncharacterized protein YraI [Rhodanobacter sp. MP7CTX1]